jgi:hypothetical protein
MKHPYSRIHVEIINSNVISQNQTKPVGYLDLVLRQSLLIRSNFLIDHVLPKIN